MVPSMMGKFHYHNSPEIEEIRKCKIVQHMLDFSSFFSCNFCSKLFLEAYLAAFSDRIELKPFFNCWDFIFEW